MEQGLDKRACTGPTGLSTQPALTHNDVSIETRRIIASQLGSNDRGLDSIEPEPAEPGTLSTPRTRERVTWAKGLVPTN
jgi:hypothetical protein